MAKETFATLINCMDGRTQRPASEYLTKKWGVDHVDSITDPGPIRLIAENQERALLESIKRRAEISYYQHGSTRIAVAGHFDCAGNPVSREEQIKQIKASIQTIKSWGMEWEEIMGLWIDENWEVHEVA